MAGFADVKLASGVARGVVRGDSDAIAAAYRLLAQAVMNLSYRILSDRDLAQEVVQDTFIELMEKASQIRQPSSVVPWVRRVAVNHCLMRLRSPWHARRLDDEEALELTAGDGEVANRDYDLARLESALATLPEAGRMVVWLHDVEGYTHKEIGELMGKTASYSKSQLARSYSRLLLWSQGDAPGTLDTVTDSDSAMESTKPPTSNPGNLQKRGKLDHVENMADYRSTCPS